MARRPVELTAEQYCNTLTLTDKEKKSFLGYVEVYFGPDTRDQDGWDMVWEAWQEFKEEDV